MKNTMRAVEYKHYGPPEVLQLTDITKPTPGDNEVCVKIHASTVSVGTLWARKGKHPDSRFFTLALRLMFGIRKPRKTILGYEFSGTVEQVGKSVKDFVVGDAVFGTTTGLPAGAYAEYVCVPEQWKQGVILKKPHQCSHIEAAALPIGGMAALFLLQKAEPRPGQKILIYGASGSVGTFATQLASNYFKLDVTGVCSTSNVEMVRTLGAHQVIDYTRDNIHQNIEEKYDIVFDAVGKLSKATARNYLSKNGRIVSVKSPTRENTENLRLLSELLVNNELRTVIDRTYALEELVEAHRYVEQGHKKGNVVITIPSNIKAI